MRFSTFLLALSFKNSHLGCLGLIFVLLLQSGCETMVRQADCLRPEGERQEQSYELPPFVSLRSEGNFELFLTQGSQRRLTVKGAANIIESLSYQVRNGQLFIHNTQCVHHSGRLYLFLEVPELESVRLEGATYLSMERWRSESLSLHVQDNCSADIELATAQLDTYLGNNATLCLRGVSKVHYASLNGDGALYASGLQTRNTRLGLNGTATATVWALDYLEATLAGGGTAFYLGNPEIKARVAGGSRLLEANN